MSRPGATPPPRPKAPPPGHGRCPECRRVFPLTVPSALLPPHTDPRRPGRRTCAGVGKLAAPEVP